MRYFKYNNHTKVLVSLIILFYSCFGVIPVVAQLAAPSKKEVTPNLVLSDNKPLSLREVAQLTLENSSAISQARWLADVDKSAYRIAKGQFNLTTTVSSVVDRNRFADVGGPNLDSQNVSGTLSKSFRSGIQSSLTIGAERQDFHKNPSLADTKGVANVNMNAVFPLLKGRGAASAAANETAAQQKSHAAEFEFYHSVSSTLKDAVNAYWEYKAAISKAQTQVESEERVLKWEKIAATAAAKQEGSWQSAKKKYTREASYLQGYLADKRRNITEATRQVNATKGALAIAMGIPADQLNQIGLPSEKFPQEWQSVLTGLEQHPMQANWKEMALDKRLDLQSSKLQQQSAMTLLIKARQDILPQLNAGLNYNYNSLEWGDGLEHYTFTSDRRGNDTMVNLTFSYPLGNDVAKGQRDLASASYQIQTSQVNNLIRTIYLQIDTATTELMSQLKAVVETRKAVETYLPSLEQLAQMKQDLANDPATIMNLVELEDRLNKAGLDYTDALLGLSKAVIDLRFQTGTLIAPSQTGERELILEDNLNSLPGIQN